MKYNKYKTVNETNFLKTCNLSVNVKIIVNEMQSSTGNEIL